MIKKIIVGKNKKIIKWFIGEKQVKLSINNLDQVMPDESRNLVFTLSGSRPFPTELHIFDELGSCVYSASSPEKSYFYYLTKNDKLEVLVVFVFEEKLDGWYDWHYYFDLLRKNIIRDTPAY